jgi:Aerotolerance regulator N-terminal/von Willebrand factor type A domain
MGFLAPWFLAGAAAIGLPIYLHLLRRHRSTPLPFSSLMFFERRTQSSIKHRRLRYLLLLAFRLAVILLLALAFANPFIERSAASISGEKLDLLVIDDSFSMRAGTRLADAKRDALAFLDSRKPSERAQVMALASQVHVLTEPSQDSGVLRSAVNSIQPGDTRASFGELAGTLRSMAETVRTPIELHLFSDLQRSAMPGSFGEMALPANVSLVLHPEARGPEPNWTVESVSAPGEVFDPKKSRVQAVISGYHTAAAKKTVSLVVNGKAIATQMVDVPANGRASVEFSSLDVPYGLTRCEVRIDSADSLPADDASFFAVKRSDPRKVLFVYESNDTRSPLYFRAALTAAAESAFNLETVSTDRVANAQPTGHDFVVLSDISSLPSSFENALTSYVKGGGSVFIAAGTSAAHHPHIPLFDDTITDSLYYSREGARFQTVGETDPSYPSLDKANRWAGVKFYFAVRVSGNNARVAARLTDQTPLLLEKKIGEGRVLLFTSGLDNLTNDFPLHPVFIPFIDQTSRYLSGMETRAGSRMVDSFLELRSAKEQSVGVEVVDPDGKRPLSLKEATSAQSFQLTRAGFYQLRLANGREDLVGVNADRRESDLDIIPKDVLALWTGNTGNEAQQASSGAVAQDQKKPYSLWWYAVLLLLAAAIAESLLSSQYLMMSREEP